MKSNNYPPLFKTSPLIYQPFPFYEKNLNPPFLQKVRKLKPSLFRKGGGRGGGCSNEREIHQYRGHGGPSKTLKFKCSCLIASTKFQSTTGAFHNLRLVSKYLILHSDVFALSILWMAYYYNDILRVRGMRVVAVTLVFSEGFVGRLKIYFYIVYWMF